MFIGQLFICIYVILLTICIAKAPLDSTIVFAKGEGGYYCHKIPYLLTTSDNTLIAFAEARGKDGREACDDFSGTDLVTKRSIDGGITWSTLALFYSNSTGDDVNIIGNAAPVVDTSTGRIWVPFCKNNEEIYISYSDDDGMTWSNPNPQPQLVHEEWYWVGMGPPAGLQLSSGRLLIPSYHTNKFKGDGCASRGHIVYSDDHGLTWEIGSDSFGEPYFANECQAVELESNDKGGVIMINARTISRHRLQILSYDGGITFEPPVLIDTLQQTIEGCEGSIIADHTDIDGNITPIPTLYFSNPNNDGVIRRNMTISKSIDNGITWNVYKTIDRGAVSYSALQMYTSTSINTNISNNNSDITNGMSTTTTTAPNTTPTAPITAPNTKYLTLLYERSNTMQMIFEPDEIVFYKIPI